ncbi:MAG: 2-oxoacid:acceptor oxidoreductase subunit alpha [Planctomycetes bacterium]|nr:2-oxoacid:acceptor oxidoreductase subunit alpha [Planctomycetota bacterium]
MSTTAEGHPASNRKVVQLDSVTIRLVGDSGDGMQLLGTQLTTTSALLGNDVATFPDYPSEIRAPKGTRGGVSGFQVQFAAQEIFTPGDRLDALVAMNPAALATNLEDLRRGGILIVNEDSFNDKELRLARLDENPLNNQSLADYRLFRVPMTGLTRKAVEHLGIGLGIADRCRNFFAMGLVYWLFGRDLNPTLRFIREKFGNKPVIAQANECSLRAGWNYGETTEAFGPSYRVDMAVLPQGTYRNLTGNEAVAFGLITAAELSRKMLYLASYPITPASEILHELCKLKQFGAHTFQAEDEIAAVCSAIGASFGGALAATTTSGPGVALKSEGIGLAVMLELPLLIVSVQRGGPSTGLPTKTEQSDLLQAVFGRHGECPLPVIAARSPADCFDAVLEAWRIAVRFMTPVMLLSDGYLANGSEPWRIPQLDTLSRVDVAHPGPPAAGGEFQPYDRDERLARPWALPGTPGLTHRLGGLEKQHRTGNVCHDPENHEFMVRTRAQKIENVADDIPLQDVSGEETGDLLVLSWGGTYGACATAVQRCRQEGQSVSHVHLRYLHPFPRNLGDILRRFKRVLVPELNLGQLHWLIAAKYLVETIRFNKVQGRPFAVGELVEGIKRELALIEGR